MRAIIATTLLALGTSAVHADPLEAMLGGTDPTLTREQVALLDALKRNVPEDTAVQTRPVIGVDNTVQYVFGGPDPTAICTPFEGCDLRLEPGEIVHEASIGDPRWRFDIIYEGEVPNETPHVTIYPTTIGLKGKITIPTNRRTYHIHVISRSPSDDTPTTTKISFLYPEDARARFAAARALQEGARVSARPRTPPPLTASAPAPRNTSPAFGYKLDGRAPWKPIRVFNDGERTFLDFPDAVRNTELPTLLMVRTQGDLLHDDELVLLNTDWDPVARRMTAYRVFDRAILVAGVGRNQVRVIITRLPPRR